MQNVEFLQLIQAHTQFNLAKADPFLTAGEITHGLKDLSRQLTVADQSFKISKFTFQTTEVRPAV
ncbi:MAG: hypothetical protein JOZ31_25385 [Verrucomicrobia bacterium]|nr:hypothetical protein [Verrucomicrobiota bacterium]MBV8482742.1 hypothetical protein [Verrucomicrobiota bacterium]